MVSSISRAVRSPSSNSPALWRGSISEVRSDGLVYVIIPKLVGSHGVGPIPVLPAGLQIGDSVIVGAIGNDLSDMMVLNRTEHEIGQAFIVPGTTGEYWRGDKTWQPLDKSAVGLANVDNTSDSNKPVSVAQLAALALKASQASVDLKAPLASPSFTGTASFAGPVTFSGSVTGVTKSTVGLGNVDNTADASKPVSTAQVSALAAKAPLASPAFTGTVTGITKAMVGLPNVDNTSDANKPVSIAMSNTMEPKADLTSNLVAPLFVSHRGGPAVYPEHSMEGYRGSAHDGFAAEPDVRALNDGTLVCIHDATVNRTMIGASGNVAALSLAQWNTARIKPAMKGGRTARPVLFNDVLDELGGSHLLIPELKEPAAVAPFIAAIKSRGLEKAVIAQAFDWATAKTIANAGIIVGLGVNNIAGLPATYAAIKAAGVDYLIVNKTAENGLITNAAAAGLRSIVWTVDTSTESDTQMARGAFGVFSNDPWWVSRRIDTQAGEAFTGLTGWAGSRPREGDSTNAPAVWDGPTINGSSVADEGPVVSAVLRSLLLPQLGKISPSTQIRMRFRFYSDATSQSRSLGFFLYKNVINPEADFIDAAVPGQWGYTFIARRSGELGGWKYVNGAESVELAVVPASGEFATAGREGETDIWVNITPATVTFGSVKTGVSSIVIPDTENIKDLTLGLRWGGTSGEITDIRVTSMP